jgi:NAD(P)-dependent dehydrogenase (short-subunit alcohol dehydrogenase family)
LTAVNADLVGRTALVTGGTDGIGKEIACGLARGGVDLVVVGRDAEKGERAAQGLRHVSQNPSVAFLQADLARVREVVRLADLIHGRWPALHYLVHDAGVVLGRRELTAEGIERNFAINYLSRFELTRQLLPLLAAGSHLNRATRIVIVSGAAQGGKVHFDDVNLTTNFAPLRAVLQSCRANDLLTIELARRLAIVAGPGPTVTCLKIGVVKTNIRHGFPGWMKLLVPLLIDPLLGQTAPDAADGALKLLLAEELEGLTGALFLKVRGLKRLARGADPATVEEGRRLWEISEQLVAQALAAAAASLNTAPESADRPR